MNIRALIAEFLGVFTLCFIGISAIVQTENGDLVATALAYGLAVSAATVALHSVSGAHFNPAVTFGLLLINKIKLATAAGYWVAQLLGAILASLVLRGIFGQAALTTGTPIPGAEVGIAHALFMEIILSFFLVSVFCGSLVFRKISFAGLAIGLVVVADVLAGGSISGAAMNPARALGPALISGSWASHWIYWVGPMVGAGLAAVLYDYLYENQA